MSERLKTIRKHRHGEDAENAFQECAACGQSFDTRSLAQILHHKEPDHRPFTEAELQEFATARAQAR